MSGEFKFPDEDDNLDVNDFDEKDEGKVDDKAEDTSDEVEVEVIDDTPEQDRGRKPLNKEVNDPTDEELEEYGARSKTRIKELTHARHDERRAKEEALRLREEAVRVAQQLIEENKKLRGYVQQGTEAYSSSMTKNAEMELTQARAEYKAAQEAFDTDAIIAAQEKLSEASWNLRQAKNFRPAPLQDPQYQVQNEQPQEQPVQIDEKSLSWQRKNQWFGAPGYEELTSFALGLDQKLRNQGVDPMSDAYYEQVDARMKKTFPEVFGTTETSQSNSSSKKPNVVASAGRTSGTRKVELTRTQVNLAKKFGLTPQQYAAELVKLEKQNG